jgi:DNA-binding GntR family transcriptional regulator
MTLMQEHGVARGTAAKAVQVLVGEGLVRIVPGRGAYVTKPGERRRDR